MKFFPEKKFETSSNLKGNDEDIQRRGSGFHSKSFIRNAVGGRETKFENKNNPTFLMIKHFNVEIKKARENLIP